MLEEFLKDYELLEKKYAEACECYEFGYMVIRLAAKKLLDKAPRHMVALETIRVATEAGIKQHVEEKEEQHE